MTQTLADSFEKALKAAKPGDEIKYHQGFLLDDRDRDKDIKEIGNRAWQLYEKGWCLLFQTRNEQGSADYLAIRIRRAA